MSGVPAPVLLLMAALAVAGLIVLWKVLLTAGLIGLAQWVVITQTESPTAVLIALGVPALVVAVLLRRAGARRPLSRSSLRLRRQEVVS
ncbi:hypothetical protein AB0A74_24795 [Saccharothrix sp. NPDC042600]|uniref:hypothetical protein n=1 Tax=Saccharothrix TaxID=2071 RepID=UPI003401F76F|nr:hypothetical protein GCM10017745_17970 [Saccharothrix mutabilis subsp. capreolus]